MRDRPHVLLKRTFSIPVVRPISVDHLLPAHCAGFSWKGLTRLRAQPSFFLLYSNGGKPVLKTSLYDNFQQISFDFYIGVYRVNVSRLFLSDIHRNKGMKTFLRYRIGIQKHQHVVLNVSVFCLMLLFFR